MEAVSSFISHISSYSKPFLALCLLLALVFGLGGSSRADVQYLMLMRPAAILLIGYGVWGLTWPQVKKFGFLFAFAATLFLLLVSHLVPLPHAIWSLFPGREIVVEIDRVAGLGEVWRPLSLDPSASWNAFYAFLVPVAVLVLGARLDEQELQQLLPVVIGLGCLSAFIGLSQISGDPNGPLYLYNHTNNGSAVGLFANRNHQALLLSGLFPMLATWGAVRSRERRQNSFRLILAILIGIVLIPLLIITGSRMGMLLGIAALLLIPAIFLGKNDGPEVVTNRENILKRFLIWKFVLLLVLTSGMLVFLAIYLDRADVFGRLISGSSENDLRAKLIPPLLSATQRYFPIGSGIGSFQSVYRMHEPTALLTPFYVNHAHNDWFEVVLTVGLAGIMLLFVACASFVWRAWHLFVRCKSKSPNARFARMGLVFILLAGIASITDYPLRVPSMACIFVLSALWACSVRCGAANSPSSNDI